MATRQPAMAGAGRNGGRNAGSGRGRGSGEGRGEGRGEKGRGPSGYNGSAAGGPGHGRGREGRGQVHGNHRERAGSGRGQRQYHHPRTNVQDDAGQFSGTQALRNDSKIDEHIPKECVKAFQSIQVAFKKLKENPPEFFKILSVSEISNSRIHAFLSQFASLPDVVSNFQRPCEILQLLQYMIGLVATRSDGKFKSVSPANFSKIIEKILSKFTAENIIGSRCDINGIVHQLAKLEDVVKRNVSYFDGEDFDMFCELRKCILSKGNALSEISQQIISAADKPSIRNQWMTSAPVAWLLDIEWMKQLPELQDSYTRVSDYSDTLINLWTILMFYCGASSLRRTCSVPLGDKICGQPLFKWSSANSPCCMCHKAAAKGCWQCSRRHDHDSICNSCLRVSQEQLLGSPGKTACTDIYDAVVTKQYLKGGLASTAIEVSQLESRKPPGISTNWATTYRLQPSSLIAVIFLGKRGDPISRESKIHWAEVIPSSLDVFKESHFRKKQILTFRFLSDVDCPGLCEETRHSIRAQQNIAILDCQSFVPEVLPVMSALQKSLSEHMEHMPFIRQLIGIPSASVPLPITDGLDLQVKCAFFNSNMGILRDASPQTRKKIAVEVLQHSCIKSLDNTQRNSFCNAIYQEAHCIQGPPGTGKSFVGVSLVVALDVMRRILNQLRKEDGSPQIGPILVLSYKNHALDEFLLDILSNLPMRPGELIRGGKPKVEALEEYAEQSSKGERAARGELFNLLATHRKGFGLYQTCLEIISKISSEGAEGTIEVDDIKRILTLHHFFNESKEFDSLFEDPCDNQSSESEYEANYFDILQDLVEHDEHSLKWDRLSQDEYFWISGNVVGDERRIFGLADWLKGFIPPPRCAMIFNGSKRRCDSTCVEKSSYCKMHCCNYVNCSQPRDPRDPGIAFCKDHVCKSPGCKNELMPGSADCCILHCCLFCYDACMFNICLSHLCEECKINTPVYPFKYCSEHLCRVCISVENSSCRPCVKGFQFCKDHKCTIENCQSSKFDVRADYCEDHLCMVCLAEGRFHKSLGTKSHVCEDHSCNFQDCLLPVATIGSTYCHLHGCKKCFADNGALCIEIAVEPSPRNMCQKHALIPTSGLEELAVEREINCSGVTRKGKPCRSKHTTKMKTWYCQGHLAQSPKDTLISNENEIPSFDVTVVLSSMRGLASATLTKCCSEACNNYVLDGSMLCKNHQLMHEWQNRPKAEKKQISIGSSTSLATSCAEQNATATMLQLPATDENKKDNRKAAVVAATEKQELDGDDEDSLEDDNANLKRKEDILDNDSDSGCEMLEVQGFNVDDDEELEFAYGDVEGAEEQRSLWSWEMSLRDRKQEFGKLVRVLACAVRHVCCESYGYIKQARQRNADMGATTLKKARVIGATVVGACKRLEAIKGALPFAIVVEEACEVMEPTLMSVLSIKSVQKLELVGDHRQLPASVQSYWYEIANRINKIERSLFERLVDTRAVQCDILDEQRRMVTSIADITRADYADQVAIIDSRCTSTQLIGDRLDPEVKDAWTNHLSSLRSKGRDIPGIPTNIFFWDIPKNSESKPIQGLSACNETEAVAVCQIVSWLSLVGVPLPSITIITPYQGQQRLLIKMLRDRKIIQHQKGQTESHGLEVHTVDRFQGDENDIIILSLVRTKPGNRFIELKNRFIVATSRARLGFYVVGSTSALTGKSEKQCPAHWNRFINMLKQPSTASIAISAAVGGAAAAEAAVGVAIEEMAVSRIGERFPLCCPRHDVSSLSQFGYCMSVDKDDRNFPNESNWNDKVCAKPCTRALDWCQHPCSLPCHFLTDAHNVNCTEIVERPCEQHKEIPLVCGRITRSIHIRSLKDALAGFQCEVPVSDYVFERCKHRRTNITCFKRTQLLQNPPNCKKVVNHVRPCGCSLQLPCHQCFSEIDQPVVCTQRLSKPRPRCGHAVSIPCHIYHTLVSIWENSQSSLGLDHASNIVIHGRSYGAAENCFGSLDAALSLDLKHRGIGIIEQCKEKVLFQRPCGHREELECWQAFENSAKPVELLSPCTCQVEVECFLCNKNIAIPCELKRDYNKTFEMFHRADCLPVDAHDLIREAAFQDIRNAVQVLPRIKHLLRTCCDTRMNIQRQCCVGHITSISCKMLFAAIFEDNYLLPVCNQPTLIALSCGHTVNVSCNERDSYCKPCKHPAELPYVYSCGHTEQVNCSQYHQMQREHPKCEKSVSFSLPWCQHSVQIPCHKIADIQFDNQNEALEYDASSQQPIIVHGSKSFNLRDIQLDECKELATYRRPCGHLIQNINCTTAFKFAQEQATPPLCAENAEFKGRFCDHNISVKCNTRNQLMIHNLWPKGRLEPIGCSVNNGDLPIYLQGDIQEKLNPLPPKLCREVNCKNKCCVLLECGHNRTINCDTLFHYKPAMCQEKVAVPCLKCHQSSLVSCGKAKDPLVCTASVSKKCELCDINCVDTECRQEVVHCNKLARKSLSCGHEQDWMCGQDAIPTAASCKQCEINRWKIALTNLDVAMDGNYFNQLRDECTNRMSKPPHSNGDLQWIQLSADRVQEFIDARRKSVRSALNSLVKASSAAIPKRMPHPFGCEEELRQLDLVFQEIAGAHFNDDIRFKLEDSTNFGGGIKVSVGNANLDASEHMDREYRHFLFGFAQQVSTICPDAAFAKPVWMKSEYLVEKGVDRVKIPSSKHDNEYMYWYPESCLLMGMVSFRVLHTCSVCADQKPPSEGYDCSCSKEGKDGFCCWECLEQYATNAKKDGTSNAIDKDGYLKCPGCFKPIGTRNVARGPQAVYDAIQELRESVIAQKAAKEARDQEIRLHRIEEERVRALSVFQRKVHDAVKDIRENILNLSCPRCRAVFVDFDGCFALTCSNHQCGAGFCAWCLADCGNDAHAHVAHCPENRTDSVHGTFDSFTQHHKERRTLKLRQKLHEIRNNDRDQGVQVVAECLICIAPDIGDLKIRVQDIR